MTTPEPTNLVYDVAHDLQTPLTALKAHLSLITTTRRSDEIRTCHEIIDSMSSMVSDLLAYARSGTGCEVTNRKRFDLSAHVIETIDYIETVARSCRVKVTTDIKPGIIVEGIPGKIDEAFLNLVSNSMKYLTASGPREITIRLATIGKSCCLSVEDTGIGISADELQYVFSRFYRTRPATRHASGSGLGLAITKKIVEMHSGRVSIESTEGVGTRVNIMLPIIQKSHTASSPSSTKS